MPRPSARKERGGGVIAMGLLNDNTASSSSGCWIWTSLLLVGKVDTSSKGSSSSPGRMYFSTERRRNGLNGGEKMGLWEGCVGGEACDDAGDPVVSDSNEISGIVSSKSNNSSTHQFALYI